MKIIIKIALIVGLLFVMTDPAVARKAKHHVVQHREHIVKHAVTVNATVYIPAGAYKRALMRGQKAPRAAKNGQKKGRS